MEECSDTHQETKTAKGSFAMQKRHSGTRQRTKRSRTYNQHACNLKTPTPQLPKVSPLTLIKVTTTNCNTAVPASRHNSCSPSPDATHAAKKCKGPDDLVVTTLEPQRTRGPCQLTYRKPHHRRPRVPTETPTPPAYPRAASHELRPLHRPRLPRHDGSPDPAGENPHMQTTQPDPIPAALPDADRLPVPFTFAVFPHVVIPFGTLTHNMAPAQVNAIKADPTKYLAILPHGAGRKFYVQNPHANCEARAFIRD
ncbi:hypothetical protein B0H14DRAFT_2580956 [Mycena olivaceomarginata]|nr:hypothetical protein B0H14DRAFT_2580956 [Mycena olivaceomarginata]